MTAMLLLGGQASKPTAPPAPKPDTWERSKECATQAEKVVAERNLSTAKYGSSIAQWENHYSVKYNRCYLRVFYLGDKRDHAPSSSILLDAFERSELAASAVGISAAVVQACSGDPNRVECEKNTRAAFEGFCSIDGQQADCTKAQDFIAEHMKN